MDNQIKNYLLNNWFLVGAVSELSSKNDFKTLDIFDQPIIIYNTGDDIKTFSNICPHRGSKIKLKKNGNEILRCDYHGWCYDKNGHFLSAPFFNSKLKTKPKLTKWSTKIFGDLIFISDAKVKITLSEYLNKSLLNQIVAKDIGKLIHSDEYIWKCNWKTAVENSIDEYHAPFLHKSTFKNILNLKPKYIINNKTSSMVMPVDNNYLNSINKNKDLFNRRKNKNYIHILFFPCTTFASTMGIFNFIQTYFPINKETTKITTNIFLNVESKNFKNNLILSTLVEYAIKFNQTVFKEDQIINENIKFGNKSNLRPIFTKYEERVKKFRKLVKL